jgi:hypothetical protein
LRGAEPGALHELFMGAAERPLLDTVVLRHAEGNQSKCRRLAGHQPQHAAAQTARPPSPQMSASQAPLLIVPAMSSLTALLSVSDKTGVVDFARALHAQRRAPLVHRRHRAPAGRRRAAVTEVAEVTGFPPKCSTAA